MTPEIEKTNSADRIYDEYLIMRCQQGEQQAFSVLVERWQTPMLKFASIVCRDKEIAKEAVQETWISVIKNIKNLRNTSTFKSWALRIVHHKCIDLIRKGKHSAATIELHEEDVQISEMPLKQLEDQDQIVVILQGLNEKHRTVLALHYLQDMSLKEISVFLDVKQG